MHVFRGAASFLSAFVIFCVLDGPSYGFRPFDSTDAATADPWTMELEIGLAELAKADGFTLASPHLVANVGLTNNLELVLEGSQVFSFGPWDHSPKATVHESSLVQLDRPTISLKAVLLPGSLQNRGPWPSIAVETGILLPLADQTSGAEAILIASQKFPWLTVHLNAALLVRRATTSTMELGLVVEGPQSWAVRPVAEVTTAKGGDQSWPLTILVGAIWPLKNNLSIDLAAVMDPATLGYELRFGLTWSLPIKNSNRPPKSP